MLFLIVKVSSSVHGLPSGGPVLHPDN